MKLNEEYKVEVADELNYVLLRKYTTKKGEVSQRVVGYYGSLENLVTALIDRNVRKRDLIELKNFATELRKVKDEAIEVAKELKYRE